MRTHNYTNTAAHPARTHIHTTITCMHPKQTALTTTSNAHNDQQRSQQPCSRVANNVQQFINACIHSRPISHTSPATAPAWHDYWLVRACVLARMVCMCVYVCVYVRVCVCKWMFVCLAHWPWLQWQHLHMSVRLYAHMTCACIQRACVSYLAPMAAAAHCRCISHWSADGRLKRHYAPAAAPHSPAKWQWPSS